MSLEDLEFCLDEAEAAQVNEYPQKSVEKDIPSKAKYSPSIPAKKRKKNIFRIKKKLKKPQKAEESKESLEYRNMEVLATMEKRNKSLKSQLLATQKEVRLRFFRFRQKKLK